MLLKSPTFSGELGLACPCQEKGSDQRWWFVLCRGRQVCEGRVGSYLWLFPVGRLNSFHQKTMDEWMGRRIEMVLPR